MIKHKLKFPIFKIGISIFILAALCLITLYLVKLSKAFDYFNIKDIIIAGEGIEKDGFSYLKGQNIFNINLKSESEYILRLYPGYKKIRIIKIYPNRLFIGFIQRTPLAFVKLYRNFCVDSDLVFFDPYQGKVEENLPVIAGLETKIFGIKSGARYNIKELALALEIIREANIDRKLDNFELKRIDLADITNIRCFFSTISEKQRGFTVTGRDLGFRTIEIRIAEDNIIEKLQILSRLLSRVSNDTGSISYIDLRFKEPVIKYKDAK